jgi:exodeoxyribonuclease V gamma subunit
MASIVLEAETRRAAPLLGRLSEYLRYRSRQISVDLEIGSGQGPRRLSGPIKGIYPRLGLLRCKPSSLQGADILALWLTHLAWCAGGEPGPKRSALHTAGEHFLIEQTVPPDVARALLQQYLSWYWEAVHRPLPVFPRASFAFAWRYYADGKGDPINAAIKQWEGEGFKEIPGDKDDPYIRLVMRRVSGRPLETAEFPQLALAFYGPVLRRGTPS